MNTLTVGRESGKLKGFLNNEESENAEDRDRDLEGLNTALVLVLVNLFKYLFIFILTTANSTQHILCARNFIGILYQYFFLTPHNRRLDTITKIILQVKKKPRHVVSNLSRVTPQAEVLFDLESLSSAASLTCKNYWL